MSTAIKVIDEQITKLQKRALEIEKELDALEASAGGFTQMWGASIPGYKELLDERTANEKKCRFLLMSWDEIRRQQQ